MKEMVRKLDADHGFGLTAEEIGLVARQAEEAWRLFTCLDEVHLTHVMPAMKVDRGRPKRWKV